MNMNKKHVGFFEKTDQKEHESNLAGIQETENHLNNVFQNQNQNQNQTNQNQNQLNQSIQSYDQNNNHNHNNQILNSYPNNNQLNQKQNRNIGIKRKCPPNPLSDICQPPTSKSRYKSNSSLCLPFENDNDDLNKHFQDNIQRLDKINNQIQKIPALNIADYVEDKELIKFIDEYKNCKKNIYELSCIEYKIKLHISANFIPKQERFRINLQDFRIKIKSQQNFEYIQGTLQDAANISNKNYLLKLKQKIEKKEFYLKLMKQIKNDYNIKIRDRKYNYHHNKNNIFPSINVKNSISYNFDAEINKTYKILINIDEHYEREYEKYKNKIILQFDKLCKKIKIDINSNHDINYNFYQDLVEANEIKELNKSKQWNNNYNDEEEKEDKMNEDEDIDNDQNKDDFDKYKPNQMIFPQVNYININNKHRKMLVNKYGNFHDKFAQKQFEKTMKINNKRNKNKNKKQFNYHQNSNYKYNQNRKRKFKSKYSFFQ